MTRISILVALLVSLVGLVPAKAQVIAPVPGVNQTVTIAIFLTAATDPNVNTPVSVVQYLKADCGGWAFVEEVEPITNPTVAFYPDVKDRMTYECRVNITNQISALAAGTYKGAIKLGTAAYTDFSTNFTKS